MSKYIMAKCMGEDIIINLVGISSIQRGIDLHDSNIKMMNGDLFIVDKSYEDMLEILEVVNGKI